MRFVLMIVFVGMNSECELGPDKGRQNQPFRG